MEYLLGIDIGTSGTKTVLFDRDANPITAKTFEYPLYQEQNGWAEQEPEDWWNAVVQGVQAVLQASGVNAADIKGIGFPDRCTDWLCWMKTARCCAARLSGATRERAKRSRI